MVMEIQNPANFDGLGIRQNWLGPVPLLRGRGFRGAMIPAKMTSEPQDLQNYLQALKNWSHSLCDVTKPPAILSPRPFILVSTCWFNFWFKFIGLTKQILKYISS